MSETAGFLMMQARAEAEWQRLVARVVGALEAAKPYVQSYAENVPASEGGDEAKADLDKIDDVLAMLIRP